MRGDARAPTRGAAVLAFAAALGAGASPAAACTCAQTSPAGHQPCRAYGFADAVFVGRAVDAAILRPGTAERGGIRVFSLAVEEAFAGVDGTTVEIHTGMGDGDCGYDFEIGGRYFVYAGRQSEGGPLEVWLCGSTRPLSRAGADLEHARRLGQGEDVPGIFGVVGRSWRPSLYAGTRVEPLPGVTVTVTGADPREVRVVTDAEGYFEVAGHLAGTYEVRADAPGVPALTVEVPPGGCAEASPAAVETARIQGTVLTAAGEPSPGTEVTLITAAEPSDRERAKTDGTGLFVFPEVPATDYLVAVNPDGPLFPWDPPYPALYYPAAAEASGATPVTATAGTTETLGPLILGEPLGTRTLRGRVVWADGRPLGNCSVGIGRPGRTGSRLGAKLDAEGRFEASVFLDGAYLVDASHYEGYERNGFAEVRVEPGDEDVAVELVLEPLAP